MAGLKRSLDVKKAMDTDDWMGLPGSVCHCAVRSASVPGVVCYPLQGPSSKLDQVGVIRQGPPRPDRPRILPILFA